MHSTLLRFDCIHPLKIKMPSAHFQWYVIFSPLSSWPTIHLLEVWSTMSPAHCRTVTTNIHTQGQFKASNTPAFVYLDCKGRGEYPER